MNELLDAIRHARTVFLCGNGGSAANAIHIANDLISCGIRAHALTADISTITAIANDFSYEEIFSRQLAVFAEKGDLLIVLSGSGNSPNILAALREAKRIGIKSWAILGMTGGQAKKLADQVIYYRNNMQRAEQEQLKIGHKLLALLTKESA